MKDEEESGFDKLSFSPINFFAVEVEAYHTFTGARKVSTKHLLPDLSKFCGEKSFADVFLGWSNEGIDAEIFVQKPIEQSFFPDCTSGDSVELFFDTRDLKSAGFNTRFCHHFCFLPEAVEGLQAAEITRFRTEDKHELCSSSSLRLEVIPKKFSYALKIFIPSDCLFGYDPDQFDRLGFTYRINRLGGQPQHFSVVSSEYQIDQHPALWSSLHLNKA